MPLGIGGQIALQGGVDIAGGVMGNLFQKRNIRLQKEANLEMADYAYTKDQEMWNLQNLYNSPKAQMQRFKQAGLNPNLIYGRGSSGNATAMPKRQQVTAGLRQTKVPTPNVLATYNNQRQVEAGLKATAAQTDQTEMLTQTQESIATLKQIEVELENAKLAFWQTGPGTPKTGRDRRGNLINPWGKSYAPLHTKMLRDQDAQLYHNNLQLKKQAILDAQIDLTLQNLKTKQRQYSWMPWEKGIGLGTKVGATALGGSAARRFSKGVAPKLKTPKFSMSPNTKFYK